MRVGVAPSRDGIPSSVFRKCVLEILPWLAVVFRGSLHHGHIPLEWFTARFLAFQLKYASVCKSVSACDREKNVHIDQGL